MPLTPFLKLLALLFPLALGQTIYVPPPPQTISAFTISCGANCNFTGGSAPAGAAIGTYSETMVPPNPTFVAGGGYLNLSTAAPCSAGTGAQNASFQIIGGVLQLATANLAPGIYAVCALATDGAFNSPQALAITVTGTQTIASFTISCGSSCSFTGGSSPSGTVIGTYAETTSPTPPTFAAGGGTLALSTSAPCSAGTGANNSNFQIVGGVLQLATANLIAGSYAVCALATDGLATNSPQALALTVTGTGAALNGFVVAVGGSDSNNAGNIPGTTSLNAPFATVQRCQTAVRAASAPNKVCNIRAGTYTGGGVGFNTVTTTAAGGWQVTSALVLTSADNGETWTEYASDFPTNGLSSAVFDGGAGAWSASGGAASGCVQNSSPTGALGYGVLILGGASANTSNITVDRLQMQNVCHAGIGIHGGAERPSSCLPSTGNPATNITISNNYIHDVSSGVSQCGGDFVGGTGNINMKGAVNNVTITHNAVTRNTGNGIVSVANECCSITTEDISNTVYSNNAVYDVLTAQSDRGAVVMDNGAASPLPTGDKYLNNYIHNYGGVAGYSNCGGSASPPDCDKGIYNDDCQSNVEMNGNIVFGLGEQVIFDHAGTGLVSHYNILDIDDSGSTCPAGQTCREGWATSPSGLGGPGCAIGGSMNWANNIMIANQANCGQGAGQCTLGNNGQYSFTSTGTSVNGNVYWNYGSGGNAQLISDAAGGPDSNPQAIDAFGNATTRCPGGNLNSWGYVIPAGNAVFTTGGYPAQPAGWGTPGFWGPQVPGWTSGNPHGFVPPHTNSPVDGLAHAPSYGPTC